MTRDDLLEAMAIDIECAQLPLTAELREARWRSLSEKAREYRRRQARAALSAAERAGYTLVSDEALHTAVSKERKRCLGLALSVEVEQPKFGDKPKRGSAGRDAYIYAKGVNNTMQAIATAIEKEPDSDV